MLTLSPTIKKIFRDLWHNASPPADKSFPAITVFTVIRQGALLRIFWKGTASPDQKTGKEEELH